LLSEHRSGQTRLAANSLLLAHEHSPDVNNKPISTPYLEQGHRCPEHYNIQFKSGTLIPAMQSTPDQ